MLDKDEELYEEEPAAEDAQGGDDDSPAICPMCAEKVMPGELAHPVAMSLGDGAILLFLHYRCYETASTEEVEEAVKGIRYDMMLAECDEGEIGTC